MFSKINFNGWIVPWRTGSICEQGNHTNHARLKSQPVMRPILALCMLGSAFVMMVASHELKAQDPSLPDYVNACLDEPHQTDPDMSALAEECNLAGKYFKENGNIGNASWVYLLTGQWDKAMALSEHSPGANISNVLYMNQGHVAALQGDYTEAEALYERHIQTNIRPYGEGFDEDLNDVLPKLYPDHESEIAKARDIWSDLYAPVEAIDGLYDEYAQLMRWRDFKESQSILEEVLQIYESAGLQETRGYFFNQQSLGDLSEINGQWEEALQAHERVIAFFKADRDAPALSDAMISQSYQNIGRIALRMDNHERALDALKSGVEFPVGADYVSDPGDRWNAFFALAATQAAMGEGNKAIEVLENTLIKIDEAFSAEAEEAPAPVRTRYVLALAHLYNQAGSGEMAIDLVETLIQELRQSDDYSDDYEVMIPLARSYHALAKVYRALERYDHAQDEFQRAVELADKELGSMSPLTEEIVLDYIQLLKRINDTEAVYELLERFSLDPEIVGDLRSVI